MSLRDQALVSVYKSVKDRLPSDLDAVSFIERFDEWTVIPLTEQGRVIGGVITKGPEAHVGYYPRPTRSIRRHIKLALGAMLEQYGYVVTTVMSDNKAGLRFCERLGFTPLSEENGRITLRCERGNFL